MRLLFVADGRSPIALGWIRYFVERGDDVMLATTFAAPVSLALKGTWLVPVAFSGARQLFARSHGSGRALADRNRLRHWLGPLTIPWSARSLRRIVREVEPDLIHAMRIPYEGMLASAASRGVPLVVSTWGNDFTLHASATPLMKVWTRRAMRAAAALHTDCRRDARLAMAWGFRQGRPALVLPGNGGVRTGVFHPPSRPVEQATVLNPRGPRAYVRNDTFFESIPLVLARRPDARFICASMAGDRHAIGWVDRLGVAGSVELVEPMSHEQVSGLFRRAQVVVSPAIHDGTPNTLLEGMASGCFPIAGDLESVREWITHGRNGLLVDASSPEALADAILIGLDRKDLRREAAGLNRKIIASRAEYSLCMAQAEDFYAAALGRIGPNPV